MQISGCLKKGREGKGGEKDYKRILEVVSMFTILSVMIVSQVYTHVTCIKLYTLNMCSLFNKAVTKL